MEHRHRIIVLLGPTACGKTSFGVALDKALSRQRMESVRKWFAARGISMDRMAEAYYHGVDYKARTATRARRAELKFVK